MKEKTREYNMMFREDCDRIFRRNNSKDAKRTAEQIAQSKAAKHTFYAEKWSKLLREADTKAQKRYCKTVLAWNDHYNAI